MNHRLTFSGLGLQLATGEKERKRERGQLKDVHIFVEAWEIKGLKSRAGIFKAYRRVFLFESSKITCSHQVDYLHTGP